MESLDTKPNTASHCESPCLILCYPTDKVVFAVAPQMQYESMIAIAEELIPSLRDISRSRIRICSKTVPGSTGTNTIITPDSWPIMVRQLKTLEIVVVSDITKKWQSLASRIVYWCLISCALLITFVVGFIIGLSEASLGSASLTPPDLSFYLPQHPELCSQPATPIPASLFGYPPPPAPDSRSCKGLFGIPRTLPDLEPLDPSDPLNQYDVQQMSREPAPAITKIHPPAKEAAPDSESHYASSPGVWTLHRSTEYARGYFYALDHVTSGKEAQLEHQLRTIPHPNLSVKGFKDGQRLFDPVPGCIHISPGVPYAVFVDANPSKRLTVLCVATPQTLSAYPDWAEHEHIIRRLLSCHIQRSGGQL
ncbi:hypothetical protein PENSPDRAFT_694414 [Peniophora sp. CONT]|nr:hypothetical protein PENSPDRAFT_694414 [Peniophora sp. CONT]